MSTQERWRLGTGVPFASKLFPFKLMSITSLIMVQVIRSSEKELLFYWGYFNFAHSHCEVKNFASSSFC